MARGLALLPALCLLFSMVAFHVEARVVPDMFDCGPLQKHRFRCDPPLTQNIQADPGQLRPTDIHESQTKIDSSGANGQKEEITTSSTSGAAHDHVGDVVEVVASLQPAVNQTSEGPECGPLEKHRFRCNPPLTRNLDINALG